MNETRDKLALVFLGAILESGVQYKIGAVGEAFRVADEFLSRVERAGVSEAPEVPQPPREIVEAFFTNYEKDVHPGSAVYATLDKIMSRDIADAMGAPHCQSTVQSNHETYLFFIDLKPEANFSHECMFCSVPADNMHLLVSDLGHFPPSAELFEKMVKIQFPKALGGK